MTDEAPIAAVGLVPAVEAPVVSPVVEARLRAVRARAEADFVFAGEVADFLGAEWVAEGSEAVALVPPRWCRVSRAEVVLGHDAWGTLRRIPL